MSIDEKALNKAYAQGHIINYDAPEIERWAAIIELYEAAKAPATEQADGQSEQIAKEIIERIWSVWYGDHRGDMQPDRFAKTLEVAKASIIAALDVFGKKSDAEMLRVKMCEHIAEGEDGWNTPENRNVCPSTMAVAELRDKYEALLKQEPLSLTEEERAKLKNIIQIATYEAKNGLHMGEAGRAADKVLDALLERYEIRRKT